MTRFLFSAVSLLAGLTSSVEGLVLLNNPAEKRAMRLATLKNLQGHMKAMLTDKILKDESPRLKLTIKKIDHVLALKDSSPKELDAAITDVNEDMQKIKGELMRKALDIQANVAEMLKKHGHDHPKKKVAAEEAFEKLLDAQDKTSKEQLEMLMPFKEDSFIAEFLKKHGDASVVPENIAMEFGEALDNRKQDEAKKLQSEESDNLAVSAHISKEQAKGLLPILKKVREQQEDKEKRLIEVESKLETLQESERFYKKHKATLARESKVLGEAATAIQHGRLKKLEAAMGELKTLGSS